MTPLLRPMTLADVAEVLKLEQILFPYDAWSEGIFRDELAQPDRYYLVAHDADETIIGYAGLRAVPPEGDVQTIAVAPDRWGQGVGRALLTALLDEARHRGISAMFLEVRSDNPRARDLYQKFGFEEVGVRAGYYVGADAIIMRRLEPIEEER